MNSYPLNSQVFVYGTLKPGEYNYQIYCQGKTVAEIPAHTQGQLYHLPAGYPAMTVGNNKVEGYLLSFRNREILKGLDRLENYRENRATELNDYYRQQIPIYGLSNNYLGKAWCYLMTPEKVREFQGQLLTNYSWQSC